MSRKPTGEYIGKAYGALYLIWRQPRTMPELCDLMGCNKDTARRYIKAALDEGLIGVVERRKNIHGPDTPVYGAVPI